MLEDWVLLSKYLPPVSILWCTATSGPKSSTRTRNATTQGILRVSDEGWGQIYQSGLVCLSWYWAQLVNLARPSY